MNTKTFKIDNLQYCNWSKEIFRINREAKLDAIHVTIAYHEDFDEVVVVMFVGSVEQITIPKQMWAGIRQETSPVILCMATCLVALSIGLLTTVEMLRRRSERLRGIKLHK